MDTKILEKYAVIVPIGGNLDEIPRYKEYEEDGWVTNEIVGSLKHFYLTYKEPAKEDERNAFFKYLHETTFGQGVLTYDTSRDQKQTAISFWKYYIKITDYQMGAIIYLPYKDMVKAQLHSQIIDEQNECKRLELIFPENQVLSLDLESDKNAKHDTDKIKFGTDQEETDYINSLIEAAKKTTKEERLSSNGQLGEHGSMFKRFAIIIGIAVVVGVIFMLKFKGFI